MPTGEITLTPRAPLGEGAGEIIRGDLVLEAGPAGGVSGQPAGQAGGQAALIVPGPGPRAALSLALRAAYGHGWPAPGEALGLPGEGARLLWRGREGALLLGAAPVAALAPLAHVIDMSDALAAFILREHAPGGDTAAVLARLTPLDLRPAAFPAGRTALSLLHRIPAQITRLGESTFEILVARSMAASAAAGLSAAMERHAARRALPGG